MASPFTLDDGADATEEAQPLALPPSYANPAQARIALGTAREARGQRREVFNENIQRARLTNSINAQDLHEAQFGETVRNNDHEMSLGDARLALDGAKLLQQLVNEKAKVQMAYRKTITAAAAVDYFSKLDPAQSNFEKQYYDGMTKYAYALDQKPVQDVIAQKRNDSEVWDQATQNRQAANYSNFGQKAWQDTFNQTGDPSLANAVAKGKDDQYKKLKDLYTHADATPELRNALIDPKSGQPNFDAVDGVELQVKQRENERKMREESQEKGATAADHLTKALYNLNQAAATNNYSEGANATTPWPEEWKNIRQGITGALQNVAPTAAQPPAPAENAFAGVKGEGTLVVKPANTAPVQPAASPVTTAPAQSAATTAALSGNTGAAHDAFISQFKSTGGQPQGPPPALAPVMPVEEAEEQQ